MKQMDLVKQALALMEDKRHDAEQNVYDFAAWAAWQALTSAQREQLEQLLFKGPIWDGDVISKCARGDLFVLGLAVRCCYKGQQGFTAAAYPAYTLYRAGTK